MSSTQMIVRSLPAARKLAFRLFQQGNYKRAATVAADVVYQVPARIKTPDVIALHVIAAVAYYLANSGQAGGVSPLRSATSCMKQGVGDDYPSRRVVPQARQFDNRSCGEVTL